jgi:hypothetical protein
MTTSKQEIQYASDMDIRNSNNDKNDMIWYQNYRREVLKIQEERKPFKKKFKKNLTKRKK